MTLKDLHIELQSLGIPDEQYYLHGLYGSTSDDNKLSMIIRKGVHFVEYEVYLKERNEKYIEQIFISEGEACKYFLSRMKHIARVEKMHSKKK